MNANRFTATKAFEHIMAVYVQNRVSYDRAIIQSMVNIGDISGVDDRILVEIYRRLEGASMRTSITHTKKSLYPSQLSKVEARVYDSIILELKTPDDIIAIRDMVQHVIYGKKHISGRLVNFFVAKYSKRKRCVYYICNDPTGGRYMSLHAVTTGDTRAYRLDVYESYRQYIRKYTKRFFDCFGRGYSVIHSLPDGSCVDISLSQFPFFIWCRKMLVIDYIRHIHTTLIEAYSTQKQKINIISS